MRRKRRKRRGLDGRCRMEKEDTDIALSLLSFFRPPIPFTTDKMGIHSLKAKEEPFQREDMLIS